MSKSSSGGSLIWSFSLLSQTGVHLYVQSFLFFFASFIYIYNLASRSLGLAQPVSRFPRKFSAWLSRLPCDKMYFSEVCSVEGPSRGYFTWKRPSVSSYPHPLFPFLLQGAINTFILTVFGACLGHLYSKVDEGFAGKYCTSARQVYRLHQEPVLPAEDGVPDEQRGQILSWSYKKFTF